MDLVELTATLRPVPIIGFTVVTALFTFTLAMRLWRLRTSWDTVSFLLAGGVLASASAVGAAVFMEPSPAAITVFVIPIVVGLVTLAVEASGYSRR